jgi:hypothetical protein
MRSSIVQSIQNLKLADEFMNDFIRQAPNTRGAYIFTSYSKKIKWILNDIVTYPHFDDDVRKGVRVEVMSDAFSVPAIFEKIPLLNPEQRQMLEDLIDDILAGKTVHISIKSEGNEGAADTDKKD